MKLFCLIPCFIFLASFTFGQSIIAYPDTIICSEEPVTLYAEVDGIWGTESYIYEVIPFAPEIIGGDDVDMYDDTHEGPFDIGFDFCFFGEVYDEFYIASNGWISFDVPNYDWDINWTPDGPIPDDAFNVPKAAIFGPWEDWDTGLCSDCVFFETTGVAPNRKLIVTWEDVPMYLCWGDEGTFQIVLHETTNIIDNHLIEVPSCPSWGGGYSVQGIQDEDGDIAFAAPDRNHDVWETEDESNRWVPNSINWYETATGTFIGTGDSIIVNPPETTTYTVEITLCDGTTVTDDVTVTVAAPYDVSYTQQNIKCYGDNNGSIDLTVTGNINPMIFNWSNGSISEDLESLPPGDYSVTIQETDGCVEYLEFTITEPAELTLEIAESQDITCFGGNDGYIFLNADGGTQPYLFTNDGDTWQTDSTYINLIAGDYTIIVEDEYGCDTSIDIALTEPAEITVEAGQNMVIPYGGIAHINSTTTASPVYEITWIPPDELSCDNCLNPEASPDVTTLYTITLTDESGCTATDEITIIVEADYAVPNIFTPNGDGLNDVFNIQADFIAEIQIDIFNRWGESVYSSTTASRGWDGTKDGVQAEIGNYIYYIQSTTTSGEKIIKTGTLILLR